MFAKILLRSAALAFVAVMATACATTEYGGQCDRPCCYAKMEKKDGKACCCKKKMKKMDGGMCDEKAKH